MQRLRSFARLLCEERGVSAIEFAFIAPVVAILIIGIIDFGMGLWRQMEIANAAEAGAAYAAAKGWNSTTSGIDGAVTSATNLPSSSITVSLNNWSNWCGCPNTSSGVTSATCGSDCSDSSLAGHYVIVSASTSYSTIVPWPGISSPLTLASTAYARLYP
jgi:Flp pilus assembly protein TadG